MGYSLYFLDYFFILRDFFLVTVILASICIYTLIEKFYERKKKKLSLYYSVSLFFIGILNIYLISSLFEIKTYFYLFNYSISNLYGVFFFKIILILFFLLIFYAGISEKTFERLKYIPFESAYILIFLFIGMLFLLYSFDFLIIFLNLELQNFALYILINIQRNNKIVVESCIKYYIIGAISSGFFLYGISLIYGFTGKINLFDLIIFFSDISITHIGINTSLVFLFCGLFIKLGIAPFHFWIPQVYKGTPHLVTLILLILPKFVLFLLFVKLYLFIFKFFHQYFFQTICVNVILSLLCGSLGALWQNNIKTFMAYSAITNTALYYYLFLYLILKVFAQVYFFYLFILCPPFQFFLHFY